MKPDSRGDEASESLFGAMVAPDKAVVVSVNRSVWTPCLICFARNEPCLEEHDAIYV